MEPIGVVFKDLEFNPFTGRTSGELVIVHYCLKCGKISFNRIAGDDSPSSLLALLVRGTALEAEVISCLNKLGIKLLDEGNKQEVRNTLFGFDADI